MSSAKRRPNYVPFYSVHHKFRKSKSRGNYLKLLLLAILCSLAHCPYQKDKQAKPGNLLTKWCSFPHHICHDFPFQLNLSYLIPETSNIIKENVGSKIKYYSTMLRQLYVTHLIYFKILIQKNSGCCVHGNERTLSFTKWHHVGWWIVINVSEEPHASVYGAGLDPDDGGSRQHHISGNSNLHSSIRTFWTN
jgi:hypothetical protein